MICAADDWADLAERLDAELGEIEAQLGAVSLRRERKPLNRRRHRITALLNEGERLRSSPRQTSILKEGRRLTEDDLGR